jgi:hypothetical protein
VSVRIIISGLVLKGNRPESPICQSRRRRRVCMWIAYFFQPKGDRYRVKISEV